LDQCLGCREKSTVNDDRQWCLKYETLPDEYPKGSDEPMGTRDVQITEELLKGILVTGLEVTDGLRRIRCVEGLPSDAILRAASVTKRGDLLLTFSSDEWVGDGLLLDIVYQEKDRRDADSLPMTEKDEQIADLQRKVDAIPASLREYIG
jgi:hypothetical protein